MPFIKAKEAQEACAINKVNNRKGKKLLNYVDIVHDKAKIEIYSKNIPKDRRFERVQITERLRKKLDKRGHLPVLTDPHLKKCEEEGIIMRLPQMPFENLVKLCKSIHINNI